MVSFTPERKGVRTHGCCLLSLSLSLWVGLGEFPRVNLCDAVHCSKWRHPHSRWVLLSDADLLLFPHMKPTSTLQFQHHATDLPLCFSTDPVFMPSRPTCPVSYFQDTGIMTVHSSRHHIQSGVILNAKSGTIERSHSTNSIPDLQYKTILRSQTPY
jgi:hypothetical protein